MALQFSKRSFACASRKENEEEAWPVAWMVTVDPVLWLKPMSYVGRGSVSGGGGGKSTACNIGLQNEGPVLEYPAAGKTNGDA